MNRERKVGTLTVLKKEEMHSVQQENIKAAEILSGLIKSCIGPKAMMKMILTRIGGMELTNDGNSILREIEVVHPVIKSLVELSRTQDEEVGDGTTSVVILATEILRNMSDLLKEGIHPIIICNSLKKAQEYLLDRLKKHSLDLNALKKAKNLSEEQVIIEIIQKSMNTKISKHLINLEEIALKAITTIGIKENNKVSYDIKNNIRIEKIPGGKLSDSAVLDGIIVQKEVLDIAMNKKIDNAKVLLIDFPLEYRKGENQMHIEMHTSDSFTRALEIEEEQIKKMVDQIIAVKPSVLVSEKGISDYAISLLKKQNITAIRRVKKSENQRISLATGAQIVSIPESILPKALGTAGLFECSRIGDEFYCQFLKCKAPKACTILLRGQSKDILNELERNIYDALYVTRNAYTTSSFVRGAGAIEMALSQDLSQLNASSEKEKKVYLALSSALQSIPSILINNSGNTQSLTKLLELKAQHTQGNTTYGIDGNTGEVQPSQVLESILVKEQTIKSAIEGSILILRVDSIVRQE
ncbi:T-complex protein 1 subunit gamma [Nematocida sp. AWRm80]|nr:T-complex protein 1 subunit gamma [Nematocida sp. AWRm80]